MKSDKLYFQSWLDLGMKDVIADMFPLVSACAKSEPGAGSPCIRTVALDFDYTQPNYIRSKRNGDMVCYYADRVLRFWKNNSPETV